MVTWPFFAAFFAVLTMLVVAAVVDYRHDRQRRRTQPMTVREPLPVARSLSVPTAWRRRK